MTGTKGIQRKNFIIFLIAAAVIIAALSVTVIFFAKKASMVSHPPTVYAYEAEDTQFITTTVTADSYPNITVQRGIPVVWTIKADASVLKSCAYQLSIPAYGISMNLVEGDNLVKFTPEETGSMAYACQMNMITATIDVVDEAA